MENKCIKKSTLLQLQALVEYMEDHPEFARGSAVFGRSKMTVEEQWALLAKKLNSLGPPVRTINEWKKSWADLKSRTKKKIAENAKSMRETGGGLYNVCNLSELEQIVDRILFLSKAAAPSGSVFGYPNGNNRKAIDPIDICFQTLNETPPRNNKTIAVVTPTRQTQHSISLQQQQHCTPLQKQQNSNYFQQHSTSLQQQQHSKICYHQPATIGSMLSKDPSHTWPMVVSPGNFFPREEFPETAEVLQQPGERQQSQSQQHQTRRYNESEDELPGCSSAKKRKVANEQTSLIRRQIRVSESSAATAKEQADATKALVEATKALVAAVQGMAETQTKILKSIEAFRSDLVNHFLKK